MRKENPQDSLNFERSRTGIPGLDDILGGGLLARHLYLVEGDPGAGKTTLSLQYLREGVENGEKCLYITLSESKEELLADAKSHDWSLDGIEILEMVADEADLDGDSQVTMFSASEVELAITTQKVLDTVARVNPSRVVFDSLSEFRLLAQSSLRYRRQILALKYFFIEKKCTVLLLDDHTSEASDLQLQSVAHGVISLEQHAPSYGAARRRLRVIKLRGADYRGGFHDFSIKRGGLLVHPRLIAAEHGETFPQGSIKSGISALDTLLGGGPERGTSTLLLGPAGSGKSTIAIQYAVAAAERGDHAYIFRSTKACEPWKHARWRWASDSKKAFTQARSGCGRLILRKCPPANSPTWSGNAWKLTERKWSSSIA